MTKYKGVQKRLRRGIYRHYKNKDYEVLGCARHTETGEEFVVYKALYGRKELWIRPKAMFTEMVEIDGKRVSRFRYLSHKRGV